MCDEWMKPLRFPVSIEQFHQLPRSPAYKYEYIAGHALLNPRPRFFHGLLDLAGVEKQTSDGSDPDTVVRPMKAADWNELCDLFTAAFRSRQPFGSVTDAEWPVASHQCLERTRTGGDGPWIESASYLAFRPEGHRAVGAILITLVPGGDPSEPDSYIWREPPPVDWRQKRTGQPHLTWVFVHPFLMTRGVGTALLKAAGRTLLQMGYQRLASTFVLGNDSSMLWHWRNGFRLITQPGSRRQLLEAAHKKEPGQ